MADRLRFEGVWKAYPRWRGRTLREALHRKDARGGTEPRWALHDVGFSVARGELVGVIGANGAGKSTLLRLAAGLSAPTRGRVLVPEQTAAILSLGELFDPDLTARENAATAALAAGVPARQVRAMAPGVFAFAELEGFEDAPLRTYSDGMRVRLAFGVLAQTAPDALLLDEVVAVGDLRFQRKCLDYVRDRCRAGAGVLFASHSLEQVAEECTRAIWLQAGGLRAVGEAEAVVAAYRDAMHSQTREITPAPAAPGALELRRNRFGSQQATIEAVELLDGGGRRVAALASGGALTVSLLARAPAGQPVRAPIVGITISRAADGVTCFDTNTTNAGMDVPDLEGEHRLALAFERLDLLPGHYFVDVGLYEAAWQHAYDYHWHVYPLEVLGDSPDGGVFRPPHRWELGPSSASRS